MADQIIKMGPLRRTITNNLRAGLQEIPQISSFFRADITDLLAYKKELKTQGIEVTGTSLIIKAIVQALGEYKYLNSKLGDNCYTIFDSINPGVAMQTEKGLFVPVIRDAQDKGAAEISKEIKELKKRIEQGAVSIDDMKGGTITISNPGAGRSEFFQSIIHDHQCLLIGIGRITKQPVVMPDDSIQVRSLVWLINNINHAIVDGKAVSPFTVRLCEILENPVGNIII